MASLLKKAALRRRLFLIILALGVGQLLAFWLLALPFRLFPSDDLAYFEHLLAGSARLSDQFSHPIAYHRYVHPIYFYYLLLCRHLWGCFAEVSPGILIFGNLLANTISLTMIILICRRITGSVGWATGAGLLFATSAWTANYYFFFFYAPFPVALILTGFTLLIYGSFSEKPAPSPVPFAAGGLLLALAFWSSPSAAVSVALVLAVAPCICAARGQSRRSTITACAWLAAGFLVVFLPYALISGPAYLSHLHDNVNTTSLQEGYNKFGYVLSYPAFSFFRLLFVYAPIEALLFLLLAVVSLLALLRLRRKADRGLLLCVILAALCLMHTLIVDLLPTTKLARTHFHAYPFVIIFLAVAGHWLLNRDNLGRTRRILGHLFLFLLTLDVVLAGAQTLKTRAARFALPEFLEDQRQVKNIYLLTEDPHTVFINQWLNDPRISAVETKELNQIPGNSGAAEHHAMLIIGPTGPGSGNSILQSASLADFSPVIPPHISARFTYLPYYAFHPPFLFEEETCLALYFSAGKPFPDSSASQIKVFTW